MAFTVKYDITDDMIDEVKRVLKKYFTLTVTEDFLRYLLKSHPELVGEVMEKSISDTYPRGILIDTICEELELQDWPEGGDTQEYTEKFFIQFKEVCDRNGLVFDPD